MITFKTSKSLKEYDSVSLAAMLRQHFVENYPVAEVRRLDDAIQIASYLHRSKVRRGKRGSLPNPPYIEHPLRVAVRLVQYFGVKNPSVVIAAILHDTVEDHPFEFGEFEGVSVSDNPFDARERALGFISSNSGYKVAAYVDYVTNPYVDPGTDRAVKVNVYQEHVKDVIRVSPEALIIKVSDFVDNAGSLHHHYEYNDRDVKYFLDRYEPLIPIYVDAVARQKGTVFNVTAALQKIHEVERQFGLFRAGLAEAKRETEEVDKALLDL